MAFFNSAIRASFLICLVVTFMGEVSSFDADEAPLPVTLLHPTSCSAVTVRDVVHEEDGYILIPETVKLVDEWVLPLLQRAYARKITSSPSRVAVEQVDDLVQGYRTLLGAISKKVIIEKKSMEKSGHCKDTSFKFATVDDISENYFDDPNNNNILLNDESMLVKPILYRQWVKHPFCFYESRDDDTKEDWNLRVAGLEEDNFLRFATPVYKGGSYAGSKVGVAWLRPSSTPNVAGNETAITEIKEWMRFSRGKPNAVVAKSEGDREADKLVRLLNENSEQGIAVLNENMKSCRSEIFLRIIKAKAESEQKIGLDQTTLRKSGLLQSDRIRHYPIFPEVMKNLSLFQSQYPDSFYATEDMFRHVETDANFYIAGIDAESLQVKLVFTLPNLKKKPIGLEVEIKAADGNLAWENLFFQVSSNQILKAEEATPSNMAALARSHRADSRAMWRRFCRMRYINAVFRYEYLFCDVKAMERHQKDFARIYGKDPVSARMNCAQTLLETLDSPPTDEVRERLRENCKRGLQDENAQRFRKYTATGLLTLTNQTTTAKETLFGKVKLLHSSQNANPSCVHVDRKSFRNVTFWKNIDGQVKEMAILPTAPEGIDTSKQTCFQRNLWMAYSFGKGPKNFKDTPGFQLRKHLEPATQPEFEPPLGSNTL